MAAKIASGGMDAAYDRYRAPQAFDPSAGDGGNSSDSDTENAYASPKRELPKRNKRKNFKPRCSNAAYAESAASPAAANPPGFGNNNNLKSARRRKTTATRRLVVDPGFSPMDLSKACDSDSASESCDDAETANTDADEAEEFNAGSENDSKIPSSFSIHNLSKPHVPDFVGAGLSQGQVSEMREYAMNTMRELLGIYGLTSEVAESISRQLPIAAFNSGECFFSQRNRVI